MARKTRTPQSVSPIDAVSALLADRAKYEQWLDDLDAKKDSTPAKVYDRVHQDYLSRLQAVMEQLKSHTATLQEHGQSLNKKLIELASAEESRVEERSEAELRAKVGEMTPAEWELVSKKADKELAKLKQDKAVIEEELERIESVIEDLTGEGDSEDGGAKKQVDELEFLKSVVGTGPRPAAKPPAPRASGDAPKPPTPTSTPAQPASATATPASTPAQSAPTPVSTPTQPAPTPASTPAQPPTPPAPASSAPSAAAAAKATPPAGIEKDPGPAVSDQPKTLKCQECSTMNYPSEWYCERCGAELTVV